MRIVIFTGPTGGHFYPAVAFSEAFKKRHPEAQILFVTGEKGRFLVERLKIKTDAAFDFLPDSPFPSPARLSFIIRIFPFLWKLISAYLKSEKILTAFRPDLSVGFGSYASFAGILASYRKRIPTLVHEQNRRMGLANAWLARLASQMAVSFDETVGLPSSPSVISTGLPIRSSLVESALQKVGGRSHLLSPDKVRILIVGGSQGARSLNRIWIEALESFSDEEKRKIAVIHLTGERDSETVKTMYFAKGIEALTFPFHEQMEELYPEADLAITRAGAGTLFELALFALPAIVIPYPHAKGHQELNAGFFEKEGGIRLLRENGLTARELGRNVLELVHSSPLRDRLSQNLKRLSKPDASDRFADAAERLLSKREACLV